MSRQCLDSVASVGEKMKLAARLITFVLLSASSFLTNAGDFAFQCTVKHAYEVTKDGQLVKSKMYDPAFKNEQFAVDRKTGAVVGEKIPLFGKRNHQVIWNGGEGNSFKSIYTSGSFVGYLEVMDWVEQREKPFVLKDSITVFTGTCL